MFYFSNDTSPVMIDALQVEADFFGITPLVKRLKACRLLKEDSCGGVHFVSSLPPPEVTEAVEEKTVTVIKAQHNWLVAGYACKRLSLYRIKTPQIWLPIWTSEQLETIVDEVALIIRQSRSLLCANTPKDCIKIWSFFLNGQVQVVDVLKLGANVTSLLVGFDESLVAIAKTGEIGVWQSTFSRPWTVCKVVTPIYSYAFAPNLILLLGCSDGVIRAIDLHKLPIKYINNSMADLLVTDWYTDSNRSKITAVSIHLPHCKPHSYHNKWFEVAYGTGNGSIHILVQYPETKAATNGPALVQTILVHTSPVISLHLSDLNLFSICSQYGHVRTFQVKRELGLMATQPHPPTKPVASFRILCLDDNVDEWQMKVHGSENLVFAHKLVPNCSEVFIRNALNGDCITRLDAVDDGAVTDLLVHDAPNNLGRYIITGHSTGTLQVWDFAAALEMAKTEICEGPDISRLVRHLSGCDLNRGMSTPTVTPWPSNASIKSSSIGKYWH